MIKPEFWASKTLMRLSRDSRLLFIAIWNFCDDYGFCLSSTRRILGDVFPIDESVTEKMVGQWLGELVESKLIIPTKYKDQDLFLVRSWNEHQTVQHKSKRKFVDDKDLDEVMSSALESHEDAMRHYLESHAPKKKEERERKRERVQADYKVFEEFWETYGYKKAKGKAESAWAKIPKEIYSEVVTAAGIARAANPNNEYRQHPTTWLNSKGWEDDVAGCKKNGGLKVESTDLSIFE